MNPPRPDPRTDEDTPIPEAAGRALAKHLAEEFRPIIRQEIANGMSAFLERVVKLEGRVKAVEDKLESRPAPSFPPMRSTMDTGRFDININSLEKALAEERAARQEYERAKLHEENMELKENRKWWWQNGVGWIVAGVGGAITLLLGWLLGKAH